MPTEFIVGKIPDRSARLRFNSIRVEFDDGFAMVTSGHAIRKAKP